MSLKSFWFLVAIALMLTPRMVRAEGPQSVEGLTIYDARNSFSNVRIDLKDAILNRGLAISLDGKVSDLFDRIRSDLKAGEGPPGKIFEHAEFFAFCSIRHSRAMMAADPHNIGFCPSVVFFYETADAPGTVHVGFRRLPESGPKASVAARGAVNELIESIIKDALSR